MTSVHLSDRMPDVRHGLDAWSDSDQLHLSTCSDCAEAWRVVSAIRIPELVPVDADAVSVAVLGRLRHEPVVLPMGRRAAWRVGIIGLAAAAALAIVFLFPSEPDGGETAFVPSREATMFPELDALLDAELEVVLAAMTAAESDPIGTVPRLGDLTDDELETLLQEVDG